MLTEAMPVKVIQICVYLHLLFCQRPIAECLRLLLLFFFLGSYHNILTASSLGSITENRLSRLLDTHFGSNDSERREYIENYYWMIPSKIDGTLLKLFLSV